MKEYKIYEKETGYYIGTIELYPEEVQNFEKEFIIVR